MLKVIYHQFQTFLILITGLILLQCSSKSKEADKRGKGKDNMLLPVLGIVVQPQVLNNQIDIIGTILANEKVDLRTEIAGRVVGIYFKEGSRISKGDKLVKIFDQDLRAQNQKLKLQLELAQKELERRKQLFEIKGISMEELDIYVNQVNTLKADAELINAQLRKTEILAPFNGVIGLRYISEGEIVSSTTPIATLQQVDPIKIEFDIPEKYTSFIKAGSTIVFTVSGAEDKKYTGSVYATEPLIDVSTRTLKVRARAGNSNLNLRPGSFIKIELLLEKNMNAILIPSEAVIPGALDQKVYIFNNGMALSKKVITGFRNDRSIQVKEGLSINDTVITSGIMQLKDSVKVSLKIQKPEKI